jgi:uncharacterized protein with HEPN domain
MKSERKYYDFLLDIYHQIVLIKLFLKGKKFNNFQSDYQNNYAVCRALEIIGEATKSLPEEIYREYPDIEWSKMAKLRDVIIHHYFGLDDEMIWNICKNNIIPLKSQLKDILKTITSDINDKEIKRIIIHRLKEINSIRIT